MMNTPFDFKDAKRIFASMTYNFFLKNKPDRSGACPIYININLAGQRARIPADLKVAPDCWDTEKRRVINCDQATDYNLLLKQLEARITAIKISHRLSNAPLTISNLIEQIKVQPPTLSFISFFEHVLPFQDLGDKTVVKHQGIFNKLKEYDPAVSFPDLTLIWFDKYRAYLKNVLGNGGSTINTNISILKRYLLLAQAYNVKIYVDPKSIIVGPTAGRIVWLTASEIDKIAEYYFSGFIPPHRKLAAGYFLFSCYTGLRISDVQARSRTDVEQKRLDFISIKGKKHIVVGISNKCREVIENMDSLFVRKVEDKTINLTLKDIANVCGIKKHITFHVARHTFATNYLLRGGTVENLQQLLGHSKITTTMKYVHITRDMAADTVSVFD